MQALGDRWRQFGAIVLDPWTACLMLAVAALFYMSLHQANAVGSTLLFVLITLTSAVLGGRITKQWVEATEGGVVVARGRSAVRSLKLLLRTISSLESRIRAFRDAEGEIEQHPLMVRRNYEEAIQACNLLQEETVSSIENWTDIVPEADIKTQIGLISELKKSIADKEIELSNLDDQLRETKGQSEAERTQLKQQIRDKAAQIDKLQHEVMERKVNVGGFGLADVGRLEGPTGDVPLAASDVKSRIAKLIEAMNSKTE
ncbi:MAG TPA: hypothetical protein VFH85_06465 [Gammaproteobacteria bacterium]|nr:hypothetical protein [Gammaproteobacteria bacterium]